jgi:hypothetical protein
MVQQSDRSISPSSPNSNSHSFILPGFRRRSRPLPNRSPRHPTSRPERDRGPRRPPRLCRLGKLHKPHLRRIHRTSHSRESLLKGLSKLTFPGFRHKLQPPHLHRRMAKTPHQLVKARRHSANPHRLDSSIPLSPGILPRNPALGSQPRVRRHERLR